MKDSIFAVSCGVAVVGVLLAALLHTHDLQPVRLIGECGGQYYAAMQEDEFPAGCAWIELIRTDVD